MQAAKSNQAMLRLRATTKDRLRTIATANRWKLAEAAEAAVEALERQPVRRPRRAKQTA
jgi:hypothetical protein